MGCTYFYGFVLPEYPCYSHLQDLGFHLKNVCQRVETGAQESSSVYIPEMFLESLVVWNIWHHTDTLIFKSDKGRLRRWFLEITSLILHYR